MRSVLGMMSTHDHWLPWSRPFRARCKARLPRGEDHGYHGRCDLRRGHGGVHVLERGLEVVRFQDARP